MAKKKSNYASLFTLRSDGRYQGSYVDTSGRRHFVCDRDPEKLWHKLHEKEAAADVPVTFRQVAEAWEREHREEIEIRTWKNYAPHYASMLDRYGSLPFSDVAAIDIENEIKKAKNLGYSRTVVNSIRSIYRMIFDYAVVHGHARYNPVTSVKLPKGLKKGKRQAPTEDQMHIICSNIDAPFGLFPFLLLCTGLRKSEALALRWEDIDWKNKEISITKSIDYTNGANPKYKSPKTDAGMRTVPILDALYKPLREAYLHRAGDLLFPAPPSNRSGAGGGLITGRAYDGLWNRYCTAAGLLENGKPAITAHHLRHGTATLMFELGVDELTAQRILGHSRIEITREIYTDLRTAQKSKSVDKLNAGMAKMMANAETGCQL